jgi:hypothetical protein
MISRNHIIINYLATHIWFLLVYQTESRNGPKPSGSSAVQTAKLDQCLDEFVFRFNQRTSLSRGMLFNRLLEQAVVNAPVTYKQVVDPSKAVKVVRKELSG